MRLAKLVKSAAALFRIQARGKGVILKVLEHDDVIDDSVEVDVDAGKITQVLRNFISNAIKFTPEGGVVQVKAFRRMKLSKREAVVQVVDSGVGMTEAQLGRIFNDIVQYNANELQGGGGSGIGLWYISINFSFHLFNILQGFEENHGLPQWFDIGLLRGTGSWM